MIGSRWKVKEQIVGVERYHRVIASQKLEAGKLEVEQGWEDFRYFECGKHQERPICLPVSLSGLHRAASNSCQDCPWSWLRPAKTISKDLNKDFGAQRLNGSYIKTHYEAR